MQDDTLLDLDSAADMDINGIENLPEFVMPEDGLYLFCTNTAKITKRKDKEGKESKRINQTYCICKTIQLADPSNLSPANGNLVGENFTMNDKGLPIWKLKARGIIGDLIDSKQTIGDVLEELNDTRYYFVGKTRIKKTKGDNDAEYENLQIQVIRKATPEDMENAWTPAEKE